jgi:cytochrome b
MRPKCVPITLKALWRYLIASSGFANCAAADDATQKQASAMAEIAINDLKLFTLVLLVSNLSFGKFYRPRSSMQAKRQGVQDSGAKAVRVWDLPTRLFHWLLVASVIGSFISVEMGGNALVWHLRFGYMALALLAFRVVWGLVGGRWSRFRNFIYSPATVLRYLRGQAGVTEYLDVGHNPLGSGSVFAMLVFLAAQVGTGLFADDEIATTGPLAKFVSTATSLQLTSYHKAVGQPALIVLILLHVAAIAYYRVRKHKNLIGPMISGDKWLPNDVPSATDNWVTRFWAATLLVGCAAGVAWLVRLGG